MPPTAASAAPVRLSRIFGLFPKEESIQDFWGPVRLAFEATFDYEASYQAESDDEVGEVSISVYGPRCWCRRLVEDCAAQCTLWI